MAPYRPARRTGLRRWEHPDTRTPPRAADSWGRRSGWLPWLGTGYEPPTRRGTWWTASALFHPTRAECAVNHGRLMQVHFFVDTRGQGMAGKWSGCSQPVDDMAAPLQILGDESFKSALGEIARSVRDRKVGGSNPLAPTPSFSSLSRSAARLTDDLRIDGETGPLALGVRGPACAEDDTCARTFARRHVPPFSRDDADVSRTTGGGGADLQGVSSICIHAPTPIKVESPTTAQAARLYLGHKRAQADAGAPRALKPQTLASIASYSRHLCVCAGSVPLGDIPIGQISPRDVARWHAALAEAKPRGAGLAGKTADTILSYLSQVWLWARREGWTTGENPCDGQERHGRRVRTKDIPMGSLRRWLAAVHDAEQRATRRWKDPAVAIVGRAPYVLFRLLLLTGARPSEARTARWSDVDLGASVIRRATSKTDVPRRIVLTPQGALVLRTWRALLNEHRDTRALEHVFPSVRNLGRPLGDYRKAWARVCAEYGDDEVWVYDLRRTAATTALEGGATMAEVAAMLGNTEGVLARHYTAHANNPGAVRAANAAGRRYRKHGACEARLGGGA